MSASAAYLATWNPAQKEWPELAALAEQTAAGRLADEWWNVANKGIVPGDRVLLLKQGSDPTGLMGAGRARSFSKESRPHWDEAKRSSGEIVNFIDVDWEVLLNPATEPLLPEAEIRAPGLPERLWNARNSGNLIDPVVASRVEEVWAAHICSVRGLVQPWSVATDEDEAAEFPEGKPCWRLHRSYERHPELPKLAKAAALRRGGKIVCTICEFDFFAKYGNVGKDFIECHHTIPVSELTEGMKTKLSDVVLVCSNCHRMLHRKRPWLTIEQLKSLIV